MRTFSRHTRPEPLIVVLPRRRERRREAGGRRPVADEELHRHGSVSAGLGGATAAPLPEIATRARPATPPLSFTLEMRSRLLSYSKPADPLGFPARPRAAGARRARSPPRRAAAGFPSRRTCRARKSALPLTRVGEVGQIGRGTVLPAPPDRVPWCRRASPAMVRLALLAARQPAEGRRRAERARAVGPADAGRARAGAGAVALLTQLDDEVAAHGPGQVQLPWQRPGRRARPPRRSPRPPRARRCRTRGPRRRCTSGS